MRIFLILALLFGLSVSSIAAEAINIAGRAATSGTADVALSLSATSRLAASQITGTSATLSGTQSLTNKSINGVTLAGSGALNTGTGGTLGSAAFTATNTLQPIAKDPLTLSYLAATGTAQNQADITRIDNCLAALRAAGLTSALVDGVFFQQQYNVSGSSAKTLSGSSCALGGGAILTPTGVQLNLTTTGQYVQVPFSGVDAVTVVAEYEGSVNDRQNATYISRYPGINYLQLTGTGGFIEGSSLWLTSIALVNSSGSVIVTGTGTGTTQVSTGQADQGIDINNTSSYLRTVAASTDNATNPTVKAWMDGMPILSATNATYAYNFSGYTGPLTHIPIQMSRLTLGANFRAAGSFSDWTRGTYRSALVFNRVLTKAEIQAAEAALRWLDARPINVVLCGDSTTQMLETANQRDFGAQLIGSPFLQNARLYNNGISGKLASGAISAGDIVDDALRRAPVGPVTRTIGYIGLGINDVINANYATDPNGTTLAAATYVYLKTAWARSRAAGIEIHAKTIPSGNYSAYLSGTLAASGTLAQVALNNLITSDPSLYNGCERVDLMLPNPNDANLFANALHATTEGNRLQAANIISGGAIATQRIAGVARLSGTLVSGTKSITDPVIYQSRPWVQHTSTSANNGELTVTVSGSTASVTSSNASDTSTFNLFVMPGL